MMWLIMLLMIFFAVVNLVAYDVVMLLIILLMMFVMWLIMLLMMLVMLLIMLLMTFVMWLIMFHTMFVMFSLRLMMFVICNVSVNDVFFVVRNVNDVVKMFVMLFMMFIIFTDIVLMILLFIMFGNGLEGWFLCNFAMKLLLTIWFTEKSNYYCNKESFLLGWSSSCVGLFQFGPSSQTIFLQSRLPHNGFSPF